LSAAGRNLEALQDGSGDIQAQKIQQIRDAIASGQLRIDPARIADGLLASVRDLLK
jgi:negative regulator of flagellin synthesis FlgM